MKKAKVAGSKVLLGVIYETSPECHPCLICIAPVAVCNVGAANPDLAYTIGWRFLVRNRVGDHHLDTSRGISVAHKRLTVVRLTIDFDSPLGDCVAIYSQQPKSAAGGTAGYEDRRFGQSVCGIKRAWAESRSREHFGETCKRVRADWLCSRESEFPHCKVETLALERCNVLSAEIVCEVWSSTRCSAEARHRMQPPHWSL